MKHQEIYHAWIRHKQRPIDCEPSIRATMNEIRRSIRLGDALRVRLEWLSQSTANRQLARVAVVAAASVLGVARVFLTIDWLFLV